MKITWNTDVNAPQCPGEIIAEDGRSILIQTDWDYPSVASTFGWYLHSVQKCSHCEKIHILEEKDFNSVNEDIELPCPYCEELDFSCEHSNDGTVPCKSCDLKAGDFISVAYEWLINNDGAQTNDPGYFEENT